MSKFKQRLLKLLFLNKYWHKFWWKYFLGKTIKIPIIVSGPDTVLTLAEYNNYLNDKFQFLTDKVGIQGLDWAWQENVDWIFDLGLWYTVNDGYVEIKFRKSKEKYISFFTMLCLNNNSNI